MSILSGKAAVALSQQEVLSCAYEDEEGRNGCNGRWRLLFCQTTFLLNYFSVKLLFLLNYFFVELLFVELRFYQVNHEPWR